MFSCDRHIVFVFFCSDYMMAGIVVVCLFGTAWLLALYTVWRLGVVQDTLDAEFL